MGRAIITTGDQVLADFMHLPKGSKIIDGRIKGQVMLIVEHPDLPGPPAGRFSLCSPVYATVDGKTVFQDWGLHK